MTKKILLFIIALLFIIPFSANASHYMGGEITWECMPNGNYRFTLKMYRECNGINYSNATTLRVTGHPSVTSIDMMLISQTDISPNCNSQLPNITCVGASSNNTGAIEEWIWTSDSIYPSGVSLPGVPPAAGWIFANTSGARNPSTNLSTNGSWFLRAIMHNYNGRPAGVCDDNSPNFLNTPATVLCTGYPFTCSLGANDVEFDSLTYQFTQPLQTGINNPCPYNSNYSYTSPLPSTSQNANNIPATLNQQTGEMNFTSFTQGSFVVAVSVKAFKQQQLVAEIVRELQMAILPCNSNNPPQYIEPFSHPDGTADFIDTAYIGDWVTFYVSSFDYDSIALPNGLDAQTLTLHTYGNQYGTNYTSTGCDKPPCAYLSPPNPSGTISNKQSAGLGIIWQTDTNHYYANKSIYNFVFSLKDDFCPVPHEVIRTASILLLPKGLLPPPIASCVNVLNNGDVELHWNKCDTSTENTFESYVIYYSLNINGPYILLDTARGQWNANTSYTHIGANAHSNNPIYYKIYTWSNTNCGKLLSSKSANVSTIDFNVFPNPANINNLILEWDHITNPPPATCHNMYYIYKNIVGIHPTLLDSTTNTTYIDSLMSIQELEYSIRIKDSSGCSSVSPIIKYKYSGTALIENNDALKINIFPNPAQNTINFEQYTKENISMELYNINGKLITSIKKLNKGLTTINISDLASGIYFVKFESESDVSFKKVVVE